MSLSDLPNYGELRAQHCNLKGINYSRQLHCFCLYSAYNMPIHINVHNSEYPLNAYEVSIPILTKKS